MVSKADCGDHYDKGVCEMRHSSVSWVFGIVITMQLSCFAWMSWLSMQVLDLKSGREINAERILNLDKNVQKMDNKMSAMDDKLDKLLAK